jgi:hypothetical protein
MKKLHFLLTVFILLASQTNCYPQVKKGDFTITYNESGSGYIRSFYMYVPADYDSLKSYPLLYAWHGSGMPGSDMRTLMHSVDSNIKAIICCPDVNGITTNEQLNTMINESLKYLNQYNIDVTRKIITGFSMGGNYAFQIGLLNPANFQGIIGLSPAIGSADFTTTMWNNIKSIRMATILGTLDINWSAVNALMIDILKKGGNLLYLVKQNVTHSDNVYFHSQKFINDYQICYNYVIGLTSIEDNQPGNNLNMRVYPNPFNDKIEIETNRAVNKPLTLTVYDVYGKKVFEDINNSLSVKEHTTLNLVNLKLGIYMLMVSDGVHTSSQKIVKQN